MKTQWLPRLFKACFVCTCMVLSSALLGAGSAPVQAATFTVTKSDETNPPGACDADCSLREAVIAANSAAGADIITFAAATNGVPITLSLSGSDHTAALGDLDVTGAITITGNGAASTIIQGGASAGAGVNRIFSFNPGVFPGFAVSITGVTLRFGRNQESSSFHRNGGALDWDGGNDNAGSLTITNSVITQNTTINGRGGGITIFNGGTVNISNTVISNNTANTDGVSASSGGGIQINNPGTGSPLTVTINDCVISGNTAAQNGAVVPDGGGIFITTPDDPGTANYQINRSVISGNTAANDGGGIYASGPVTISASTLSGNVAVRDGGGLFLSLNAGLSSAMTNTTVSGNTARDDGGGIYTNGSITFTMTNATLTNNRADSDTSGVGAGGGLRVQAGTVRPRNTIIAGNFKGGSGTTADDISGSVDITQSYNNLIGTGGSGGLSNGTMESNQVSVADPRLGSLANNGGTTPGAPGNTTALQTHALSGGSPALDAGNNVFISGTDQRGTGYSRTLDGPDANTSQTVDIGALEQHPALADISNQSILEDATLNLTVNVGDASVTGGIDTVTATSDNTTLVPNANISVTGSGASRTLSITPAANQSGTATITVVASDVYNGLTFTSTDTFVLTVTAVNDEPTLDALSNLSINEDAGARTVSLSGISAGGGESQTLTVTASSNNTGLIPHPTVTYTNPNATGSISFTPAANQSGTATITVTVTDDGGIANGGDNSISRSFTVTINPVADAPGVTGATTNEDTQTSSGLVITRNAVDNTEITHFKISNISNGTLFKSDGTTAIANNAFITAAEGALGLKFTPASNFFGTGNFFVQGATDNIGSGLGSGTTATITVNPVADTPSVTSATTPMNTQTTSGLVITRNAVDGAEVTHYKITGITNGTLFKHNGTTSINNNDFITAAEGAAGLKFTPTSGFSGTGSFNVQASTSGSDAGLGGSVVTASITVTSPPSLSINDVSLAEGNSGITNFSFTITLSAASSQTVTVQYATSNGTATAHSDYQATSTPTTITFNPSDLTKTVTVPVLGDTLFEANETFNVNLSGATNATIGDAQGVGTITNDDALPALAAGGALISEFRVRGPGGATDEYVEIANTTTGHLNVSGWKIAYPDGSGGEATVTVPANTVIPKGGHLLFTGSGYSLGTYAASDVSFTNSVNPTVGIPDNGGIVLRNTSGDPQDAAGFTGAGGIGYREGTGITAANVTNGEYAFMRRQNGSPLVDNTDNATDFDFVSVTGGAIDGVASKLGAPGPEGLSSPNLRNDTLTAVVLPAFRDTAATSANATFGTLALRYKVTNNGSQKITRLRFRAVLVPSGAAISGGTWQTANGTADLRLLTSANTTATINGSQVDILGSSLEQPPTQINGGGLNSSMSLNLSGLTGGGIAPTETVNVQFTFGIMVKGTYRVVLNMEGLP